MLPPDDVLVAHLTLLGFVGWNDGSGRGEWAWTLAYGKTYVWVMTSGNIGEVGYIAGDIVWQAIPLDTFPRPLLRRLAEYLLERSDES